MNDSEQNDALEEAKRRYQWYAGYDRENGEYDKEPDWALDIDTREEESSDEDATYTSPETVFFNKYDPEHIWIQSDTTHDLMAMR